MLKKIGTMLAVAAVLATSGAAFAQAHKLTGGRHPARAVTGVVNINAATAAQLDMLPGVGRHTAGLILAYREKQPFRSAEEIVKVKGVGQRTFSRIKPYLTVSGPTTLAYAAPKSGEAPRAGAKEGLARPIN